MRIIALFIFMTLGLCFQAQQQTVDHSINPNPFEETQSITITIDGSSLNESTWGIQTTHALYLWAWSTDQNFSNEQDCPTNGTWTNSNEANRLTYNAGSDTYTITFIPTDFFSRTNMGRIGFLVKAKNGSGDKKSQDILYNVGLFQVNLTAPLENSTTLLSSGSNLAITANNSGGNADYELFSNDTSIHTATNTSSYSHTVTNITSNAFYRLEVTKGTETITKTFSVLVNPGANAQAMPAGLEDGINYNPTNSARATLVLNAPGKDYVYVAGSFNEYQPSANYAMKKDPATGKFWLELLGLTPGEVQTYQYWVVDNTPIANSPALVKTADPFSPLVLSPFDDPYIPEDSYPSLPEYPEGQEREVTAFVTGQAPYNWQVPNFDKPDKEDLIIYELLIRDFTEERTFQSLIDRMDHFVDLNINAIELMPVMEFEGNDSWGYNPSFHMALDKYYGTQEKFKEFIDLCHQNNIAVILDIALNHVYGRNPLVRMWMNDADGDGWGPPATDNPYMNTVAMHSYNVGEDINHSTAISQYYVKRIVQYWIEEYKIDGFRWDLTKGFTQNCTASDESCTNAYQQDRVDVLKMYADYQWEIDNSSYVIFEHLGTDAEEQQWANYRINENKGIMTWGIMNEQYGQNTMGYSSNSNINRIMASTRGFDKARLVGYAESHDEERLMYKNITFGNDATPSHDVTDLNTALSRMDAMGAVLYTVPGPKMLWQMGELGYDYSINHCEDGTINNNCRLSPKPVRWDYANMAEREAIYDIWAQIFELKKNAEVFSSNTYNVESGDLKPRVYIWDDTMAVTELKNIVIISNFTTTTQNTTPFFPYTGTWYNLLDNSTLEVTNTFQNYSLEPGDFRIFGNQPNTLLTEDVIAPSERLYLTVAQNAIGGKPAVIDYYTESSENLSLEIYSISGIKVHSIALDDAKGRILLDQHFESGIYLVQLKSMSGLKSVKMIVE